MVDDQVTVLVVEDDADTALFVRTVLERRGGMAVVVAHEAMAALAEATRRPPDVVLTDIQLPGMSGLELLGELRRLAPGVPVVVMTAFASVDYAVDALHRLPAALPLVAVGAPAQALVGKPNDGGLLQPHVCDLLQVGYDQVEVVRNLVLREEGRRHLDHIRTQDGGELQPQLHFLDALCVLLAVQQPFVVHEGLQADDADV